MRPLLCFVIVAAALGCDRTQPPGTVQMNFRHLSPGKGEPAVTFGQDAITTDELKQRFLEMPPMGRTRFQTLEQKRQYVEGLARFELLAQEALRRGLQNDPDVVHAAKQMMVQRLLRQELDDKPSPISDAELAEYYQKRKNEDYVKPELLRLSTIFFEAPKDDAAKVAEKKAKAEAIFAKAKALPPMDYSAFGLLARESSDHSDSKARDGDLRFLSLEQLGQQWGPEVAAAASALKQPGEVVGPVQTAQGFHVLKLQGRQAALNLTLEDVKSQLQNRMIYERRNMRFSHLMDDLKKKSHYQQYDAALSKVEVDLKAPTSEPKGPPPGFIPDPSALMGTR